MREALIILPKADNHGNSLDHVRKAAICQLIEAFGGCTVNEGEGHWLNEGKLYSERVHELVAAYSPSDFNDATLRGIAIQAGHAGHQEAVYVRYASGEVEIIDTLPAHADAA